MRRIHLTRIALALSLFSAAAGLVACTSGRHGTPTASSSATLSDAEILAVAQQYSQCMREHGVPSFGDPELRDRGPSWPVPTGVPDAQVNAAEQSCQQILSALPAELVSAPPVSDADMQKLLQFAQCIRANGIPEWPDPKSDGTFPLHGTPLEAEGKSQRLHNAEKACQQYWDKGINIS
jgi:hypothetical protein